MCQLPGGGPPLHPMAANNVKANLTENLNCQNTKCICRTWSTSVTAIKASGDLDYVIEAMIQLPP